MGLQPSTPLIDSKYDQNKESIIIRRVGQPSIIQADDKTFHLTHLYDRLLHGIDQNRMCLSFIPENSTAYTSISYAEVHKAATSLAKGLLELNLLEKTKDDEGRDIRIIGVMSITRYEWFILEIASWFLNVTLVPLYTTLGKEAILHILQKTEMTVAFAGKTSMNQLGLIATECKSPLKNIISFESEFEDVVGFTTYSMKKIIDIGIKSTKEFPTIEKDCITQICYTSGTTGIPKGVVITHKMIVSSMLGMLSMPYFDKLYKDQRYFSCLPMAHAYEFMVQLLAFFSRCVIGFSTGNVKTIMNEMKAFKPHITSLVPKLLSRVVSVIDLNFSELTGLKRRLVNRAVRIKLENINKSNQNTHMLYDRLVFNKTKSLTGGNLKIIHSGSAPVTLDVFQKFQIYLCTNVHQGYGLTETIGAACVQEFDNKGLSVGIPFASLEFKIVNIPELNYMVTDLNEQKLPEPRGLLCIRGSSVFPRYYKDPQNTQEAFRDGWLCTGDVVSMLKSGHIKIIDRVKSLIKLAQGEYISPERLEGIYGKSLLISQIFIYGDSTMADLVAIVFPEKEACKKWTEKHGVTYKDHISLMKENKLKMAIAEEMKRISNDQKLNRWEFPKNIWLSEIELTAENGLATPTMKIKRRECGIFFKKEIENCYSLDYLFPREDK